MSKGYKVFAKIYKDKYGDIVVELNDKSKYKVVNISSDDVCIVEKSKTEVCFIDSKEGNNE